MEYIEHVDRTLFLFLNGLHALWLDPIMFFISKPLVTLPFIIWFFWLIVSKNKAKESFFILLLLILTITIADRLSVIAFKNIFLRYRPTHNVEIEQLVHTVNSYKGGLYGFVSSHAANMFALTTITWLVLQNKPIRIAILVWTILVCYTRIYLGVHYPADIICGALLGIAVAFGMHFLYKRIRKT